MEKVATIIVVRTRVYVNKKEKSCCIDYCVCVCVRMVRNQLGLPEQVDVNHWLNLSAVEEHFYKQQYRCCAHELQKVGEILFR